MLLGCTFGQRLEPVRDMGDSILNRPLLHAAGGAVRCLAVEGHAIVDAFEQSLQRPCVEVLVHLGPVEHKLPEVVGGLARGILHFHSLLLERFLYEVKSVHKI